MSGGLCFVCGGDHFARECPSKDEGPPTPPTATKPKAPWWKSKAEAESNCKPTGDDCDKEAEVIDTPNAERGEEEQKEITEHGLCPTGCGVVLQRARVTTSKAQCPLCGVERLHGDKAWNCPLCGLKFCPGCRFSASPEIPVGRAGAKANLSRKTASKRKSLTLKKEKAKAKAKAKLAAKVAKMEEAKKKQQQKKQQKQAQPTKPPILKPKLKTKTRVEPQTRLRHVCCPNGCGVELAQVWFSVSKPICPRCKSTRRHGTRAWYCSSCDVKFCPGCREHAKAESAAN